MIQAGGLDLAAVIDRIVDQVRDYAIVATAPDGTIASWNAGAERLHGFTHGEAVGRPLSSLFTADDRAAGVPDQLLDQTRATGSVEQSGWRVRKDGTRFWADGIVTA